MVKDRITITISRELLKKIDEARGMVSRSAYIEALLASDLNFKRDKAVVK